MDAGQLTNQTGRFGDSTSVIAGTSCLLGFSGGHPDSPGPHSASLFRHIERTTGRFRLTAVDGIPSLPCPYLTTDSDRGMALLQSLNSRACLHVRNSRFIAHDCWQLRRSTARIGCTHCPSRLAVCDLTTRQSASLLVFDWVVICANHTAVPVGQLWTPEALMDCRVDGALEGLHDTIM